MAISSDWDINFSAKVISHVDGDLDYDTNTGTAPSAGDYIRGATSGAVGKILSGTDLGGTSATGTLTLTNVVGRFQNNESLVVLDRLTFNTVTNGGFSVGDTLDENGSGTAAITVYAIEFNYLDADTAGSGRVYGIHNNADNFTNGDQLDNTTTGVVDVANATGAQTNGASFTGTLVNEASTGTIAPKTVSKIINYDGGTVDFIRFSSVTSSSGGTGVVQKVYGVTATGSLRLVDIVGTWADNDTISVTNKLNYDNLQSGQRFKVNDKIEGATSGAGGRIIGIVDDGDNTGRLTLSNQTGTFTLDEQINVVTATDTYVADVENSTFTYAHATQFRTPISSQLASQGGIYNGDSLNAVRDSNALYTLIQDAFDEIAALDDDIPMTAQVALQQFTLVNDWKIPDLSYRFLESGSIQDSSLDNIWTNYQTLGTVEGIGDIAYGAISPLPQFYIEQAGSVIAPWWYNGHIDVLVKVKTNTLPTLATSGDGVLVNSGTVTVFNRTYTHTYDHFSTTSIAGVAAIPLATASDLNNQTGTHSLNYETESGGPFLEGEEFSVAATPTKRGIITSLTDNGTTGTIEYVLTGTVQFADTDAIVGSYSGCTAAVDGTPTSLVAGYGTKIVIATIEGYITYSGGSGTFIEGEQVTQATTSATAIMMYDDTSNSRLYLGNVSGTFSGANTVTGATSGATKTFASSTITTQTTINRDIGDGAGAQPYKAVVYLDRDQGDGVGDTLARMYEWLKYRTRSQETTGEPPYNLLGGPGTSATGSQGRIYTTLDTTYALVKASPFGTFAGGTFFGARGVFIQDMALADVQAFQLTDSSGVLRFPPVTYPISITVLDSDNAAIEGAQVFVRKSADDYSYTSDSGNNAGDANFVVNEVVDTDIPQTGWIHVWDASTNTKQNYRYSSWASKTFTFPAEVTGNTTSGGTSTTLNSTGIGALNIEEGDTIRNTTDGSWAIVDELSANSATTTALAGGSDNTWQSSDAFSVHKLAINYTDNEDLVDIPILNAQTDSSGEITATYAGSVPIAVVVRIRSNTGATKYVPFNTSGAITSAGFSLTAILTEDTVAT